jgi:PAS domain S-box-containing protein
MPEYLSNPILHNYPTLLFASGIAGGTLLTLLAMEARKSYPGSLRVIVGLLFLTAALVVGGVKGYSPDAIWIFQVTAIIAFALISSGVHLFCAPPKRGHWPFVYVLASMLLITYLFFTRPLSLRIVVTSLLLIPIFVDAALPLLRTPPAGCRFGYRFTAMVLMLFCVAASVRIAAIAFLRGNASPYFAVTPANAVFFYLVLFLQLAFAFGFIALTHERLVAESKITAERLLLALEASQSGTFERNIKTNINTWGPMLERLYGFEPGTFPGTREAWLECVHPEDVARVDEANEAALKTGYFGAQWRIRRKNDRQIRWMLAHARVHFDRQGKPERMIGINIDVTDRKNDEERIRLSEQRYRSLVRASSQLVWTCDGDGYLTHEVEDWQLFTGQTAEQVRGLGWSNAIHPEDRDKTLKAWQHAVETKSNYEVEYRLRRHDGTYRVMQTHGVPVLDSTGRVIEWVGMCIDVMEQRLAEERLRRNEKLAVAGRLALNISHEINNPLAGATNLIYLIGNDPGLSQATRTFVGMAEQELARASQAVTRNLRVADTSSRAGDADLGELADSVTDFFRSRFETDHIAVECDYRTKARLRCYPHELQDVIANLLSNAHDAMRSGGKLKIRIREARSWNDTRAQGLRLTIADTGTGIRREVKHKVFEPFFTTKEETGAGLGLWVSSEIVRKHKGKIALRTSTDSKHSGTVFSLFFPFQNDLPVGRAQEQSTSLPFAAD